MDTLQLSPRPHSVWPCLPRALSSAQAQGHWLAPRAKPSQQLCPPHPRGRGWSRPGSNHSSGSGRGAPGSRRSHPGAEFSVRAPCPCSRPLQNLNATGPALTCHTATASSASILGLSSCFLTESTSTALRTLAIGAARFSSPFLLD